MKFLKTKILIAAAAVALTSAAHAQTYDLSFSGNGISGTGTITASTDDGSGEVTATAGSLEVSLDPNVNFQLDPVPAGPPGTTVTLHDITNANGDLFGDNLLINGTPDSDGLIFTLPAQSGNVNGFDGDVYNLWGNGGDSFTLAYGRPDFAAGIYTVDVTGTIVATPEPSSWALGLIAVGFFGLVGLRRTRA
jgi:hypothetical protein